MNRDFPRFRFLGMLSGSRRDASLSCLLREAAARQNQHRKTWESAQAVSPTAQLEYRIDSLQSENRRMKEQVNAMAAENRSLTAKNAELETKLTEAATLRPPPLTGTGRDRSIRRRNIPRHCRHTGRVTSTPPSRDLSRS